MPPEENMDVPYSEEPIMSEEAPSTETPEPEVTPETEPVSATEPVAPEELFELPDGRQVNAETLSKEWKENFYPDYTRKSQALAAKDTTTKEAAPSTDPEWIPQSYEELLKVAEERVFKSMEQREQEKIQISQTIENNVIQELDAIKKIDSSLNENALFLHANKYGFRDLKTAHQNMKDMSAIVKTTQEVTAKNIAKRADPVSSIPGGTGVRPDPSAFGSAVEYMRSLK